MAWYRTFCSTVVSGTLLAAVTLHAASAAGQTAVAGQSSPPTYAIPLKDGGAAIVWWDAVSDPAHPGWRCDVRASQGSGAGPTTTMALTAAVGDWRAALVEAREMLKGRVVGGE
jgi:hypothetical protein